jgi:polysaccharide export outer membrane protein
MPRLVPILSLVLLLVLGSLPAMALSPDYRLRPGDVVEVSILGHPELSVPSEPVRPDGQITMPLVHELPVAGHTVSEVTALVTRALKAFLADPPVVVSLVRVRPLRVTLLGQVGHPGTFDFEEPPTLLEAIASAGGLTERAERRALKVVEPGRGAVTYELDDLLTGRKALPRLQEGSVVEVGEVWGPDLYRVTVPVLTTLITAAVIFFHR